MAIAFDAASGANTASNASSINWNHTIAGSDTVLFVFVETGNNSPTVTFNGVSMTQMLTDNTSGYYSYLFGLVAPSSGTHTVVVTLNSGTNVIVGSSASYTGMNQSLTPDSSNTGNAFGAGNVTLTTTVVGSNAWLIMGAGGGVGTPMSAGSGTTMRDSQANAVPIGDGLCDSNGTVGTGSQSLTILNSSPIMSAVIVSMLPSSPSSTYPGAIVNNPVRG